MSAVKHYRSENGRHIFTFNFVQRGDHIDIYCALHPAFNGRDPSVINTHLYSSGQLCFVEGHEPRTQDRAEELAKQWAEYFLEYRRTGIAQQ